MLNLYNVLSSLVMLDMITHWNVISMSIQRSAQQLLLPNPYSLVMCVT